MGTKKLLPLLAVALIFICGGCWSLWLGGGIIAGAGITAASMAYINGELKANVNQSPVEVAAATVKAFEKMNISKVSSSSLTASEEIIGRTTLDEKVKITAEVAAGGGGSTLYIRIGVFGNEALSRSIYEEILRQLPAPAPAGK